MPLKMLSDRTLQFLGERAEQVFAQITDNFFELAETSSSAEKCAPTNRVADPGREKAYFDAIKLLRVAKDGIVDEWSGAVSSAFDELLIATAAGVDNDRNDSIAAAMGALGDDHLEEVFAFDRMVAAANERNRSDLHQLRLRISKAVKQSIRLEELPLSPEFITEQFAAVLRSRELALQPKLALFALFDTLVLGQLPEFLAQCNQLLGDLGILPDSGAEITGGITEGLNQVVVETVGENVVDCVAENSVDNDCVVESVANNASGQTLIGVSSKKLSGKEQPGAETDQCFIADLRSAKRPDKKPERLAKKLSIKPPGDLSGRIGGNPFADILAIDVQMPGSQDVGSKDIDDQVSTSQDSLLALLNNTLAGKEFLEGSASLTTHGIRHQIDNLLSQQTVCFTDLDQLDQAMVMLVDELFDQLYKRFGFEVEAINQDESGIQENQQVDGKSPELGILDSLLAGMRTQVFRAVLAEPSILELGQHPFRRLLNEMVKIADCLGGVQVLSSDPLYGKLDELLSQLAKIEINPENVSELLSDLFKFVDLDRRRAQSQEQSAMAQARAEENINLARQRVETLLNSRLVGKQFSYGLVEFVEQAWAEVLFDACLASGMQSEQWLRSVHLLDQVLGLESVSEVEPEFLDRLIVALNDVLLDCSRDDCGRNHDLQCMYGNIRRYFLEDKNRAENLHPMTFDRAEAQHLGDNSLRIQVDEVVLSLPGESNIAEKDLLGLVDDHCLMEIDSLKKGAWLALELDGEEGIQRCRLIGIIQSSDTYVFANRSGCKTAMLSRNRLALQRKKAPLILPDNSRLFDEALSAGIRKRHLADY